MARLPGFAVALLVGMMFVAADVEELIHKLKSKDNDERRAAAKALAVDAKAVVPDLAALLKNGKEQKEVQEAAATALGKIGKPSVATLSAAVKDAKLDVLARKAAANALAEIGPDAREAIPSLIGAIKPPLPLKGKAATPAADIRAEAITALGKIATTNDKDALDALQTVIDEKARNNVRRLASDALKAIKERK